MIGNAASVCYHSKKMNHSLLLPILLAAFVAMGVSWPGPAPAADEFAPVPTLAILYFDNATGADHLSWLPKGFADLLIRDVERVGRVKSIPRKKVEEATATYLGTKATAFTNKTVATRIGKILGATHVLTGRFTRRDTDLVIEIKLYETRQGRQLGWRQIDGPSDDLMYLQKQAGLKTFELLNLRLTDREFIDLLQIQTTSPKALAYYSLGLDAMDQGDRDLARSHFQTAISADKFFRPAVESISGMAFVLSGKAILRTATSDTAVVGTAGIKSVADLIELARTNAFDFNIGEPVASPIEGDTVHASVKLPIHVSVRPDFVNLWLYSIRRLGREAADQASTAQLEFARPDLFDKPVVLSLPSGLAREWLDAWRNLTMRLVFQDPDGQTLFETQKVPVPPLYIGDADAPFAGFGAVHWQIDTAFEVDRVPKQFFEEPLQVGLEIDR